MNPRNKNRQEYIKYKNEHIYYSDLLYKLVTFKSYSDNTEPIFSNTKFVEIK